MKHLFLFLFALSSLSISAQNLPIKGKVLDTSNEPLTGVTVSIKGTNKGTITDLDGNFSFDGEKGSVLVFSYVGMNPKEVKFTGQPLNIVLGSDVKALDDLVVVGYQTIKKKDLTGAVSVVKGEDMSKSAANTLSGQLQGLATGVNVRSSGRADGDAMIQIRGIGSRTYAFKKYHKIANH